VVLDAVELGVSVTMGAAMLVDAILNSSWARVGPFPPFYLGDTPSAWGCTEKYSPPTTAGQVTQPPASPIASILSEGFGMLCHSTKLETLCPLPLHSFPLHMVRIFFFMGHFVDTYAHSPPKPTRL